MTWVKEWRKIAPRFTTGALRQLSEDLVNNPDKVLTGLTVQYTPDATGVCQGCPLTLAVWYSEQERGLPFSPRRFHTECHDVLCESLEVIRFVDEEGVDRAEKFAKLREQVELTVQERTSSPDILPCLDSVIFLGWFLIS